MVNCHACGKSGTMLYCPCKQACYCTKACQRSHWPAHRKECSPTNLRKEVSTINKLLKVNGVGLSCPSCKKGNVILTPVIDFSGSSSELYLSPVLECATLNCKQRYPAVGEEIAMPVPIVKSNGKTNLFESTRVNAALLSCQQAMWSSDMRHRYNRPDAANRICATPWRIVVCHSTDKVYLEASLLSAFIRLGHEEVESLFVLFSRWLPVYFQAERVSYPSVPSILRPFIAWKTPKAKFPHKTIRVAISDDPQSHIPPSLVDPFVFIRGEDDCIKKMLKEYPYSVALFADGISETTIKIDHRGSCKSWQCPIVGSFPNGLCSRHSGNNSRPATPVISRCQETGAMRAMLPKGMVSASGLLPAIGLSYCKECTLPLVHDLNRKQENPLCVACLDRADYKPISDGSLAMEAAEYICGSIWKHITGMDHDEAYIEVDSEYILEKDVSVRYSLVEYEVPECNVAQESSKNIQYLKDVCRLLELPESVFPSISPEASSVRTEHLKRQFPFLLTFDSIECSSSSDVKRVVDLKTSSAHGAWIMRMKLWIEFSADITRSILEAINDFEDPPLWLFTHPLGALPLLYRIREDLDIRDFMIQLGSAGPRAAVSKTADKAHQETSADLSMINVLSRSMIDTSDILCMEDGALRVTQLHEIFYCALTEVDTRTKLLKNNDNFSDPPSSYQESLQLTLLCSKEPLSTSHRIDMIKIDNDLREEEEAEKLNLQRAMKPVHKKLPVCKKLMIDVLDDLHTFEDILRRLRCLRLVWRLREQHLRGKPCGERPALLDLVELANNDGREWTERAKRAGSSKQWSRALIEKLIIKSEESSPLRVTTTKPVDLLLNVSTEIVMLFMSRNLTAPDGLTKHLANEIYPKDFGRRIANAVFALTPQDMSTIAKPIINGALSLGLNDLAATSCIQESFRDPHNLELGLVCHKSALLAGKRPRWTIALTQDGAASQPFGPTSVGIHWAEKRKKKDVSSTHVAQQRLILLQRGLDPRLYTPFGPSYLPALASMLLRFGSVYSEQDLLLKRALTTIFFREQILPTFNPPVHRPPAMCVEVCDKFQSLVDKTLDERSLLAYMSTHDFTPLAGKGLSHQEIESSAESIVLRSRQLNVEEAAKYRKPELFSSLAEYKKVQVACSYRSPHLTVVDDLLRQWCGLERSLIHVHCPKIYTSRSVDSYAPGTLNLSLKTNRLSADKNERLDFVYAAEGVLLPHPRVSRRMLLMGLVMPTHFMATQSNKIAVMKGDCVVHGLLGRRRTSFDFAHLYPSTARMEFLSQLLESLKRLIRVPVSVWTVPDMLMALEAGFFLPCDDRAVWKRATSLVKDIRAHMRCKSVSGVCKCKRHVYSESHETALCTEDHISEALEIGRKLKPMGEVIRALYTRAKVLKVVV